MEEECAASQLHFQQWQLSPVEMAFFLAFLFYGEEDHSLENPEFVRSTKQRLNLLFQAYIWIKLTGATLPGVF